jgi:hypothetical protein
MASTQTFKFGPGAREMIELRVWTAPNRTRIGGARAGDARHLIASAIGHYDVAVEVGYERVAVAERVEAWTSERDELAGLLEAARGGCEHAADELAVELVERSLEDWTPDEFELEDELEEVGS